MVCSNFSKNSNKNKYNFLYCKIKNIKKYKKNKKKIIIKIIIKNNNKK